MTHLGVVITHYRNNIDFTLLLSGCMCVCVHACRVLAILAIKLHSFIYVCTCICVYVSVAKRCPVHSHMSNGHIKRIKKLFSHFKCSKYK